MDPHARLAALAENLRRGTLDTENRDLLAEMVERAAAGRDATEALGLRRRPGQRTWQTREALAERDRLLREAAARFLSGWSVTQQASLLHAELLRYRSSAWTRERVLERCPDRYQGTIREHLWRVLHLHDYVLAARSIRQILAAS